MLHNVIDEPQEEMKCRGNNSPEIGENKKRRAWDAINWSGLWHGRPQTEGPRAETPRCDYFGFVRAIGELFEAPSTAPADWTRAAGLPQVCC